MNTLDIGNALFEGVGAFLSWQNVRRLIRDRTIKGVDFRVTGFWAVWGAWNVYYYPALDQWFSGGAGVVLCAANLTWFVLALRLPR